MIGTALEAEMAERAMNRPARQLAVFAFLLFSAVSASAQVDYRETPFPLVTAEREAWYLAGEPVMFAGNIYYPAGAQVHFRGNEMVRSGFHMGVPLYTRTTIEPYSIVYVPLQGGVMQPYERRRTGDLAGTVGSTTPSFPVGRASEETGYMVPQAPAPPGFAERINPLEMVDARAEVAPRAVGTSGYTPPPAAPVSAARRAETANGLFIEFDSRRWFSAGPAVALDPSRLTRIGDHHGFPVYAERSGDTRTIYVPVTSEAGGLVARYSLRPRR